MKLFKLILWIFVLSIGVLSDTSFASDSSLEYVFFYGNGCTHCVKVEEFFVDNNIKKSFNIQEKEVYFNRDNLKEFNKYAEKLKLSTNDMWVPFMVINWTGGECSYIAWDGDIIKYFQDKISQLDKVICNDPNCTDKNCQKQWAILSTTTWDNIKSDFSKRMWFLGIMLPAAISDSINPCAFAVMLLLLSTILSKHKSRKKTILAWLAFFSSNILELSCNVNMIVFCFCRCK